MRRSSSQLPKSAAAPLGLARLILLGLRPAVLAPAQHRPGARQELPQAEWLGDIVVGPELEPDHPVDLIAPMAGGDDHRQVGMGADLAQEVQPVFLAEPEVEDDQARLARRQMARHFLPA